MPRADSPPRGSAARYPLLALAVTYGVVALIGTPREIISTATTLDLHHVAILLLRSCYWTACISLVLTWVTGHRLARSVAQGITFGLLCARMLGAAQGGSWIIVAFLFGMLAAQVYVVDTAESR